MLYTIRTMLAAIANSQITIMSGQSARLSTVTEYGKQYEFWLLAMLCSTINTHPDVSVILCDCSGRRLNSSNRTFVLRGGPGQLHPASSRGTPGFIYLEREGREYEIHNSLEFLGISGASHEFDIALIPRWLGTAIRSGSNAGNPESAPIVTVECKYVDSTLSVDVVRQVMARAVECDVATDGKYVYGLGQGDYMQVQCKRPNETEIVFTQGAISLNKSKAHFLVSKREISGCGNPTSSATRLSKKYSIALCDQAHLDTQTIPPSPSPNAAAMINALAGCIINLI